MKNRTIAAIVTLVAVVGLVAAHHHHVKPKPHPTPTPNPISQVCHATGSGTNPLPDPTCTPGSTYPGVTQANIQQTICVRGWTSTIRPPQSYTTPLKIQSIKDYGYSDTRLSQYEEDHLIPLELGGSPTDVKNLWAEFDAGHIPNPKDYVEGALRVKVCNGTLSLATAQQEIATNWLTAK